MAQKQAKNVKDIQKLLSQTDKAYKAFKLALDNFNTVASKANVKIQKIKDEKKLEEIRNKF